MRLKTLITQMINFLPLLQFLNVFDLVQIFIVSLLLNTFFLSIINFGFLGVAIQARIAKFLENKIYLFCIFSFLLCLLLLLYFNLNVLYLDNMDQNVRNCFINSPLEQSDSRNQFVIETITNNLLLHFIMLYLLCMVLVIFISKLLINQDFQFNKIKNYPLGIYIH